MVSLAKRWLQIGSLTSIATRPWSPATRARAVSRGEVGRLDIGFIQPALAELLPDDAERIAGDSTETVPLSALEVGDLVLVRPGSRVPVDGVVDDGAAL